MATLVSVHGKFLTDGLPAQGEITFSDPSFSVDSSTGAISTPAFVRAYLNQTGEFYAKLPLNVGPNSTPQPRSYRCEINVSGASRVFDFVLNPSLLSVELSDLMAVTPAPALPAQYVASIGGLTGSITYNDFVSTFPALSPAAGKSAYQLWLDQGNTGSLAQFLTALRGVQGLPGDLGPAGVQGDPGPRGPRGSAGPAGRPFRIDVIVNDPVSLTSGGVVSADGQATLFPAYSIAATLNTAELWYFDGVEWHNLGSYRGAKGDPGPSATKASVGLANVANLAPADLPISTAVQSALTQIAANVGQVKSVNGATGDVSVTAASVGLGNVANITTQQWPFSDALTTKLSQVDANIAGKYTKPAGGAAGKFLQGNDTWKALTSSDVGLGNVANFPSMATLDGVTSLDTLTSNGVYQQTNDASASASLSYPITRSGFLEVLANISGTRMVTQTYLAYGYKDYPPRLFTRSLYGAQTWSAWRQVLSNGIEDVVLASMHTQGGYGLSSSGTANLRSLVLSGAVYPDSTIDGGPTSSAIVYPFAPSADTSWTQYPQGISYWRIAAGQSGSPTDYPLLTGVLVVSRQANYPRQELWGGSGPAYVRSHVNGSWTNWKPVEQEMATGQFVVSLVANTIKTVAVTFPPGRFSTVPIIQMTAVTTVPDRVRASVNEVTLDGFNAYCWRNTDSNTTFGWLATVSP